jgi:hypothetical protein
MFELRSLVEDQIHHAMLISKRNDMLYDAYSNAPPGQRCPMCGKPFALPSIAGMQRGDVDMDNATTTG